MGLKNGNTGFHNRKTGIKPAVTLFFLSPIIAELLFGSTPLSRIYLLVIESLFYGSAVLLIRELVRRNNLSWPSIIMLGIAAGILEECVLLQSVFNPSFLKLDMSYGRTLGVNWVWAVAIIGYHAIWSFTIPIAYAELIFPKSSPQAWLNKTGIIIVSGVFIFACLIHYAIFYKMSGFSASPVQYLISAILIVLLIFAAIRIRGNLSGQDDMNIPPKYLITWFIPFAGSILWLTQILLVFLKGNNIPSIIVTLAGIIVILWTFIFLKKLRVVNKPSLHRFWVCSGALMASMIYGLIVLYSSGNKLDFYSQWVFIIITLYLLSKLKAFILRDPNNVIIWKTDSVAGF